MHVTNKILNNKCIFIHMYLALEDRAPKNVWPRAPNSLNPALVTHYAIVYLLLY